MPVQIVDGVGIHYLETGGGAPTLCLIHGAGGNTLSWIRQLEGLADAARVVALDLPGHGESEGGGCRRIEDYARVVGGFISAAGLGRVVLGGHSMGGGIAQTVALEHPELLAGLVLVGTGARLRVLRRIFELLAGISPGAGGEIQLTDAISQLLAHERVLALRLPGRRFDCGSKLGYLEATVEYGLRHPEIGEDFARYLKSR